MIKRWRREFIQEILDEMRRKRSTVTWRKPDDNTWVVDIDGYVELVVFVQRGGTTLKFALNEKVAQRDNPADERLVDSARAFFQQSAGCVKLYQHGIQEAFDS